MTTGTGTGPEPLRARFGAALAGHLADHLRRRRWDAGQVGGHQRVRLRALLARAAARVLCPAAGWGRPGTVRAR